MFLNAVCKMAVVIQQNICGNKKSYMEGGDRKLKHKAVVNQ